MSQDVLVLNVGSSSLKAAFYAMPEGPLPVLPLTPLWERSATSGEDWEQLLRAVAGGPEKVSAIGHRIVHGGVGFREPARITESVRSILAELSELAPEHNTAAVKIIDCAQAIFDRQIPHIAVFDTAFHATLPQAAYTYGGPYEWLEKGIRRYGFHGLSHRYATSRAAEMLGKATENVRLVTCHLGNGCSLAAIRDGISVDTTMGFTPLEGLLMGTRSGSIDPAIVLHLQRSGGAGVGELDRLLNKESGLKGLSGVSSDMRKIESAREQGEPRAILAFDCFIHQLCRNIGAMLASTGEPDAIVFTGGIGEHSAAVRQAACDRFQFLTGVIDRERNSAARPDVEISAPNTRVRVLVIEAQEDWEIAKEVQRTLRDE